MKIKQLTSVAVLLAILSVGAAPVSERAADAHSMAVKAIKNVPAPEIAEKAAQVVAAAKVSERQKLSVALVGVIAVKNPNALPSAVAAIAAAAPEVASVTAAAAAKAAPKQAELIAIAAAQAAPSVADEIAAAVAKEVPDSALSIANAVAKVLPQSTAKIMASVGAAVPNSPLGIRRLTTTSSANHVPGHGSIFTRPGGINGLPKPDPTNNNQTPLSQPDPRRYVVP